MSKIFIYGVPGVGKTHFSKDLGKKLGLPVFEGDKLKSKARKGKSRNKSPFLFLGTCWAYKEFGQLNKENAIKGLLAVRDVLHKVVIEQIESNEDFILEGAFLDPNSIKRLGRMILVVVNDEARHKRQFLTHREKLLDFQGNEFKAARMIQDYLITEARNLGIEIVNNVDSKQHLAV